LFAFLLCSPGLVEFALFFSLTLGHFNLRPAVESMAEEILITNFWLAIDTALISIACYLRFPLRSIPWFVITNLVINIAGLLFVGALYTVFWRL
jgi:hypothetical protein